MRDRISLHYVRAAIAIVIITSAWIFRGILVTFLIEPIGWLLWAGWRVLTSLDQGIFWTVLVIVSAALVLRLALIASGSHVEEHATPEVGSIRGDRLAHWQAAAARAEDGSEGLLAFRARLEPLASSVAEMTRTRLPPLAPEDSGEGLIARLSRLLPGHRRISERRAIEELLAGMESALELTNEPKPE
jgi:hypothetical protein